MMAVELHIARELLLPSRFLADNNNNEADNNILSNNTNNNSSTPNTDFNFPNNNNGLPQPPFGSSSPDSSSPELASFTETETDDEEEDDDYIAELTRQMAHYMFQDDDNLNSHKIDKSWGLDGCPHSSLLCSPNHGIPKWDPREPSPPPTTPEILKQRTNSACEIMGTLEQLKISNEVSKIPQPPPQEQFQSMLQNPSSTPISVDNPSVGFCSNQALLHQIRAIQFYRLKQEQLLKQQTKEPQHHPQFQKKNRGHANGSVNGVGSRPTPWVNQQQKNGSGMRAVFLGGSSSTSNGGSGGTGVFLPCVIGNTTTTTNQSRKKRGCSPVLIPAKVVQALRVHFDRMGYNISDLPEASTFPLQQDSYKNSGRSSEKCPEKKRHSRAVPAMKRNEMGLPQEWTY